MKPENLIHQFQASATLLILLLFPECINAIRTRRSNYTSPNDVTTTPSPVNATEDPCFMMAMYESVTDVEYEMPEDVTFITETEYDISTTELDINTTESPDLNDFYKRFSPEFLKCKHVYIKSECYEILENGSAYIASDSYMLNASDYYVEEGLLRLCPKQFGGYEEFDTFDTIMNKVTIIGIAISAIGVFLHMVMFVFLKSLRNLPGYCLFSLCVALLLAYGLVFVRMLMPDAQSCSKVGMAMYYFFLSSFFWMNTMAYDVWRSLRLATVKLRRSGDDPMLARFTLYSLYCWGSPMLILLGSNIAEQYMDENSEFRLAFHPWTCWFMFKYALIVYFAVPFAILMCSNVGFFMSSSCMMCSTMVHSEGESRAVLWTRFKITLRLFIVMGLTWMCGFFAIAYNKINELWYFYAVFNSLQGILIFLGFTLSDKVKSACKRKK